MRVIIINVNRRTKIITIIKNEKPKDHTRNTKILKANITIKQRFIGTIVLYVENQKIFKDGIF